jgi:malonate-semialdehyde dehydrogenase (acetylating)/methylmalonate-semialdehyde dehydrogenase
VDYGPVVTPMAKENILRLVQSGVDAGRELVVDGRDFKLQGYENGFFRRPAPVRPGDARHGHLQDRDLRPGPVDRARGSYEEALKLAMDHEYGNGTAIFTRDGDAARDFANRVNIGMVGVNVPIPVPLAYHTFGGWKKSVFGDLNQHGPDAFRFYTKTKTVTARWPSGIKEGGEFTIPVMDQRHAQHVAAVVEVQPPWAEPPLLGDRGARVVDGRTLPGG